MSEDLDRFLCDCLRGFLTSQSAPAYPKTPAFDISEAFERISFHGLALLLVQLDPEMRDWPTELRNRLREQARLQSFWETTHRQILEELFGTLSRKAIHPIVFKGTALAYSVYSDPALRRRGDTDFLISKGNLETVRQALKQLGFKRERDTVALQETWRRDTTFGFSHYIDVHWRWKSSAAISVQLEKGLPEDSVQQVMMGSSAIRIPDTIGTIILLSVNRCSHDSYGYRSGDTRISGSDRLIWAVDFALLARLMTPAEWDELPIRAARASCSRLVRDALEFAVRNVGAKVPQPVLDRLNQQDGIVTQYLFASSSIDKLKQDLFASADIADRLELLKYRLFPSRRVLAERFPDSEGWSLPALQARRLALSLGRVIARRS